MLEFAHLEDDLRALIAEKGIDYAVHWMKVREEQILRMRFGIGEKSDFTLEEVGQRFAVTRERIRQIEAKSLKRLRRLLPSKVFEAMQP